MRKRKMMMAEDERRDAEEAERDMARERAVTGAVVTAPFLADPLTAKQRMMDKRLMMKVGPVLAIWHLHVTDDEKLRKGE